MASDIFAPGDASSTQTATPGALAPADVAGRLAAIRLLLARLGQSGGAAQTFGDFMSRGPRRLPPGTVNDVGAALMQAVNQPGAFERGPAVTNTKSRPSSPSTFQDTVTLLYVLRQLLGQGTGAGSTGGSAGGGGLGGLAQLLGIGGGAGGVLPYDLRPGGAGTNLSDYYGAVAGGGAGSADIPASVYTDPSAQPYNNPYVPDWLGNLFSSG